MKMENVTFIGLLGHVLFEENFDDEVRVRWCTKYNWLAVPICLAYVYLVFQGQKWMKQRSELSLRIPLTLWSLGLALFSACGTYVIISYLWRGFSQDGFQDTLCSDSFYDGITGRWVTAFGFSKVLELIDTMFIVLRKKELIFLHWFHHSLTLLFVSYSGRFRTNVPSKFTIAANFVVHTIMYSYYAVKATGLIRIPKQVNVLITTLQLIQMVAGFFIYIIAMQLSNSGTPCPLDTDIFYFNSAVYIIYFVLFCNFFYNKYIVEGKRDPVKKLD